MKNEQAKNIIKILAANDPDFHSSDYAAISEIYSNIDLPVEILEDVFAVLERDSSIFPLIKAVKDNPDHMKRFASGTEIAVFSGLIFLFRTHIKVKRSSTGKWEFLIEHKPGDSKLLTSVLGEIAAWIDKLP